MGHVDHAVQEDWAALVVKLPEAQLAHSWSELVVAAALMYLPAAHAAPARLHVLPSFAAE